MKVPVLFNKNMWCDNGHIISPSSKKPKLFVEEIEKIPDLAYPFEILNPLVREDFYRVHDKSFVNAVFDLKRQNGFGTIDEKVADTLFWTSSCMFHACLLALVDEYKITCAPVSGFHHAGYDFSMGFCTFNGLMVASAKLFAEHPNLFKKIAIIDCDAHYGNGTDDILRKLPDYKQFIYHNSFAKKFPDRYNDEPYTKEEGEAYLREFDKVERDLQKFKPSVIIYQAGADVHINDPYGGVLTTEHMYIRDQKMFGIAKKLDIPIAWNLAGGYQVDQNGSISKVLDLHINTIKAAKSVYEDSGFGSDSDYNGPNKE